MKVNPKDISTDLCITSIEMLDAKIKSLLSRKLNTEFFWIPDREHSFPIKVDSSALVDVVLLGGFLTSFFTTGNWPDLKYRLWVVSNAVKNVLISLLQINDKYISVLPRYELFQTEYAARFYEIKQDSFDLIYAGRISPVKNIEATIWLVNFLQMQHNVQVKLVLIGDFDNMFAADRGRWEKLSYQSEIKNLIKSLSWKLKPKFIAKMGSEEWHRQNFKNPVLINLSTFMCEDYNVSLAQAQQQGWPSIITNWGGHRDQIMNNALMIPWQLIGRSDESKSVIKLKSEILARYIMTHQNTTYNRIQDAQGEVRAPQPIDIMELDKARRKVLSKLGPEAYLIEKEGLAAFADTDSGRRFFAKYRMLMGESKIAVKNLSVILVNDLNTTKNALSREIRDSISKIKKAVNSDDTIFLISARDVLMADNLTAILQCNKIYFSFFTNEAFAILKNILLITNNSVEIKIYLQDSSPPELEQELTDLSNKNSKITLIKKET